VAELTITDCEDLLLLDCTFLLVLMLILSSACDDDDVDDDAGSDGSVGSMIFISLASDEDAIKWFTSLIALVSRNLGRRRGSLFG
jgi:hypothetical protein